MAEKEFDEKVELENENAETENREDETKEDKKRALALFLFVRMLNLSIFV